MPSVHATPPRRSSEERRLFYVGVTRARDDLEISWSRPATPAAAATGVRPGSSTASARRTRSPTGGGARARRTRKERTIARCRTCNTVLSTVAERKLGRCADCPATYDEALYERLRAWRSEQATAQKVPAYVVFTDATLTAIAEVRPREATELLKVPGVGRTKLEKYGVEVLALCDEG